MATIEGAIALKMAAVAAFLFPGEQATTASRWLAQNFSGFGIGFDDVKGWYVRAYLVTPIPDVIQELLDLVPAWVTLVENGLEFILTGPFRALGGAANQVAVSANSPVAIGATIAMDALGNTPTGTLCAFVRSQGADFFLSCQHILDQPLVAARVNGLVLAAGPANNRVNQIINGSVAREVGAVATVGGFVHGQAAANNQPNRGDWGLASLTAGLTRNSRLPGQLGALAAAPIAPSHGLRVVKAGGGQQSQGSIIDFNADVIVTYPHEGTLFFSNQILVTGDNNGVFATAGDSGALVVDQSTQHNAVGMVFSGGNPPPGQQNPAIPSQNLTAVVPLADLFTQRAWILIP